MSNFLNPLKMKSLDISGPFVLSPENCSLRRKQYFERANHILGTYASIAAYSNLGEQSMIAGSKKNKFQDDTKIRINLDSKVIQCNFKTLKSMFKKAGVQLTNQTFLMVYGNFEAFISDLIVDALSELNSEDPEQEALNLMMKMKWNGKIDRIAQKLGLNLNREIFIKNYKNIGMNFLGIQYDDPIIFLDKLSKIRHLIAHYAGRVNSQFIKEFPDSKSLLNKHIMMSFSTPYDINFYLVKLTDIIDYAFCKRFNWSRELIAPEKLVNI